MSTRNAQAAARDAVKAKTVEEKLDAIAKAIFELARALDDIESRFG